MTPLLLGWLMGSKLTKGRVLLECLPVCLPTNNPPLVRQEIYRNILLKVVLHNYNLFINWFLGKINFCFFHVSGSCLCQSPYICAHVTPMNIPWDVDNSCALVNKFRVGWIWAPSVRGDWTARHSTRHCSRQPHTLPPQCAKPSQRGQRGEQAQCGQHGRTERTLRARAQDK